MISNEAKPSAASDTTIEPLPELSLDEALAIARKSGVDAQRVQFYYGLTTDTPFAVGHAIDDREFWKCALKAQSVQKILQIADSHEDAVDLAFDEVLYREFSRTGNRAAYELFLVRKSQMLLALTVAECVHNDHNDLDLLEAEIRKWLAMPTWVAPAHDKDLRCLKGQRNLIDLASSVAGNNLAIIAVWFEDRLPPELIQEIQATVYQRSMAPYIDDLRHGKWSNAWWADADHNWNSVCHAGVVGAALALPNLREQKALILASAEHAMREKYLPGFAKDGFCHEGLGYWNYGFGQFLAMALLLREYTDG
ncbi:MAG: hypothetical protein ACQKBV_01500, partial [Puniceicoccales bacterium]